MKKATKLLGFLMALCLAGTVFTALHADAAQTSSKDELNIAMTTEPTNFDVQADSNPAATKVREQIFSRLVRVNADAEIEGDLAESWEISEDGTVGSLVEVSCETDFVATNAKFKGFVLDLAKVVAENDPADIDAFMACPMNNATVDEALKESIFVIGENQKIVRFCRIAVENGAIASYVHHDGKHADIVEFSFNNAATAENDEFKAFAHDVAMQVIASDPISARREDIPQETIDHETEIYRAQAAESGRPEKFWDGIINGRLKKFFQERALTEQVFVKDGSKSVSELCAELSKKLDDEIQIVRFIRYNFGE